MSLIEWAPTLSVGVAEIDTQHKKWIGIINKLNDAMKERKTGEVLENILKEMKEYVAVHFSAEENLMQKAGYSDFLAHKNIHNGYLKNIDVMIEEFKSGKVLMSLSVMNSLRDWLTTHIQIQDKKYSAALNAKGIV
jgi:hemerythrin